MRSSGSTYDAKRKGKDVYEGNNDAMAFADFIAQRGNKGIIICENNVNSQAEEMAKFMGTSNDYYSGQNLQFQNMMNQVSPDYFLSNSVTEMSVGPRRHNPRIIVHPSKIISPSISSQDYNQNMQRISVSAPYNFSLLKLLMEEENIYTLTDETLPYAKKLLITDQGLSLEEQGMQQSPYNQVALNQNMQMTSESTPSNFSYMKLLMEVEERSKLTNVLREKQLLSTQYNLLSEGQMLQQWPCSGVGNYQFENSSGGQLVQQWPFREVGTYQFENSLQQINLENCQNQELQQMQQTSDMKIDDISLMDLLTREDISYMDLLATEGISWTLDA